MKIRFDSPKESRPTEEQGLQVLYAPGKRLAFRLRWYLILLLVASPLLWLGGQWLWSALRIEAAARLHVPMLQLRAFETAQISEVLVAPGQLVAAGEVLLRLDNPQWRERLALLAEPAGTAPAGGELPVRERQVLEEVLALAERRLAEVRRLYTLAAATRGEVFQAEVERAARRHDLLQFEQSQLRTEPAEFGQRRLERQWLERRLAALEVRAPEAGRVLDVAVAAGESVAPGLPLLSLERQLPAQIWVYLPARHAAYASPGQALTLRLPDGSSRAARVVRQVRDTAQVPAELQPPFGSAARTLLVLVESLEPWPERWRMDRLGLQARFARDWRRAFGLGE
jgi:multidrug resistance efflux pump